MQITIHVTGLEGITAVLEKLVSVMPGQVPAPQSAKVPKQKQEKPQVEEKIETPEGDGPTGEPEYIPTAVELREAAAKKAKAVGNPAIKALLEKYESKSISNVPEDKRAAFMAELEAL